MLQVSVAHDRLCDKPARPDDTMARLVLVCPDRSVG